MSVLSGMALFAAGWLVCFLQPKFLDGYEWLIRWRNNRRGKLPD